MTLSLGLLLRDADDAVREGDGERLSRVWKFLTFLYRAGGNNKYALAGLRLTASHLALLSPRQSHRLKWNRFAARESGTGRRLSRDLLLENNNLIGKEDIKALGFPNINNQNIISQQQEPLVQFRSCCKNQTKIWGCQRGKHTMQTKQDKMYSIVFCIKSTRKQLSSSTLLGGNTILFQMCNQFSQPLTGNSSMLGSNATRASGTGRIDISIVSDW